MKGAPDDGHLIETRVVSEDEDDGESGSGVTRIVPEEEPLGDDGTTE